MIIPGLGTLLQHSVFSTPTYTPTTIAQRVTISPPSLVQGSKDNTTLDDICKVAAPTLPDPGQLNLNIQYDPADATHTLLTTCFNNQTTEFWRLVFNDGPATARSNWQLTGWVMSFTPGELSAEGNLTADVVIQLTKIPVMIARATGSSAATY